MIDFTAVLPHFPTLIRGLGLTLVITAVALAIGAIFGLVLALLRMSDRRPVVAATALFIDFFRTTPPLIQIMWAYFVLPALLGLDAIDAVLAVVIALGFNTAAFMAEIYRAGVQAVEKGQWDAGRSLGLSRRQVFRLVVFPQAVRITLPPIATTSLLLLKASSLAAVLAVLELTRTGELISLATFRPLETFTIVGFMYFIVIYPLSRGVSLLERRLRVHVRAGASA